MKNFTITAIILCLLVTVLTGCGGRGGTSSSNEAQSTQGSGRASFQSPASTMLQRGDSDSRVDDAHEEQGTPASAENETASAETENETAAPTGEFSFTTTDINGNRVSFSDYCAGKRVIMINFWEPWCGPCVREMPDLERLYQDYKDQGFLIIGVYTTPDSDGSVTEAVRSTGISYPCIVAPDSMYKYMTDYVPTTFFVDGNGNILSEEPIIVSNSYSGWESILKEYL